jgi:hypothetical protein
MAVGVIAATTLGLQGAASAAPTTVTGTTVVSNHQDNGHGSPSLWAYDDFNRTLTVSLAAGSTCGSMVGVGFDAAVDNCFTAHIADNGHFNAIRGAGTPNGTGGQISNSVTGSMAGTYDLILYAPSADALTTANIPSSTNDNYAAPHTTTTNWPTLAFTTATGVVESGGPYSWTYTSACEKWVDSSANSDGALAGDGNITGANTCVVYQSGQVLFQNDNSDKCLNVLNGAYVPGGTLNQYTCNAGWAGEPGGAQRFRYYVQADGTRYLEAINPFNGHTLYVEATTKGANLSLTTTPVPYRAGTGGYLSWNTTGTRLYMDVQNYSKANLANVHGWTLNSPATPNQQWRTLTPA